MEKSVTTQLLQEALGRFGGDVDWINTGFDQLLFVGDFLLLRRDFAQKRVSGKKKLDIICLMRQRRSQVKIMLARKTTYDTRTKFHRHNLLGCKFWICVWDLDVAKLWVVKILTESITILEFIEIVNLFTE